MSMPKSVDSPDTKGLIEALRQRPTATVREVAQLTGYSTDALYEAIARGESPWKTLRVGRAIRIPTGPLLESLGLGRGGVES